MYIDQKWSVTYTGSNTQSSEWEFYKVSWRVLPMVAKFKKIQPLDRNGSKLKEEKRDWWQEYIAF